MARSFTWVVLMAAGLASAQTPDQPHHRHMSADVYAKNLDHPSREAWQKPHEVVQALGFQSDEVVADIGAGTGYFARRFAHHAGKVYAVDIDQKLLDMAGKDAAPSLQTILASADDPKLPPASVDTIFFCDVLHHVEARSAYYGRLKQALKPGGRIVIVDFHKRPLPVGPPPSMKISREELIAELDQAGLGLTKEHTFLPHQYFLEFRVK